MLNYLIPEELIGILNLQLFKLQGHRNNRLRKAVYATPPSLHILHHCTLEIVSPLSVFGQVSDKPVSLPLFFVWIRYQESRPIQSKSSPLFSLLINERERERETDYDGKGHTLPNAWS